MSLSATRVILGNGSASSYDVRQAVFRDAHGELHDVVVMTVRDDAQNARQYIPRRVAAALQHIAHPNVEPLLHTDSPSGQLIMRLPDGGSLRSYVAAHPAADALPIARELARAVLYLHTSTPCIIHGNLDLSAVFMRAHTPRLWDFANCRLDPAPATGPLADHAPQATGGRDGMLAAIAPELHRTGQRVTTASDVYAFGILLFELFARRGPFASFPPLYAAALLYEGRRPSRNEIPSGPRGDAVWAIIARCWAPDPVERPDMRQVEADLQRVP